MADKNDGSRSAKLAAALKDNLKRRKAQAKARGAPGPAKALGTAPQAGLGEVEDGDQPQKGPTAAKKRP